MIRDQWYIVLDSKEVKDKPVGVTRMSEKLVFWRNRSGKVSCLKDKCVHRGAALSSGKIVHNKLQCPFHGFEYDELGTVIHIPAYGRKFEVPERFKVSKYATFETNGFIYIFWGDSNIIKTEPEFFADITEEFSYGSHREMWPVHYSRAIENQLDVVHLPFVHESTIGRGNRTVVDGPIVKWVNEDKFEFFVYNRVDDGTIAKKPSEMPEPNIETDFKLAFKFPNLWQNYISVKVRVIAAFVPIDEEHTMIYLRFYQSFLKINGIKSFFNMLTMPFNVKILHQDRRVVITQRPKKTTLKMNEKLIQGDLPILEYRKRRDAMLKEKEL